MLLGLLRRFWGRGHGLVSESPGEKHYRYGDQLRDDGEWDCGEPTGAW